MTTFTFDNISRFTSEAVESLVELQKIAKDHYPKSARAMSETIRLLRVAEKFSLPDDAMLLDLKTYKREYAPLLRLPYPIVTLECRTSLIPGRTPSSRHILIAWTDEASTSFKVEVATPGTIYYTHLWLDDEVKEWEPSPIVWGFHPDELVQDADGEIGLTTGFHNFPCHPEVFDSALAKSGEQFITDDLEQSLRPLLEFCLTVNCQNVPTRTVSAPEKLKSKRAKNKREPLYDYHVLDIPGYYAADSDGGSQERNGPRLHWRRGHLRRLADDRVIWVRHALVGNVEQGIASKSYRVRDPSPSLK